MWRSWFWPTPQSKIVPAYLCECRMSKVNLYSAFSLKKPLGFSCVNRLPQHSHFISFLKSPPLTLYDSCWNASGCVSCEQKQLSKASLKDLRNRADAARDRLSRHRILIDRYLPTYLYLGPTDSVNDVVEYKVSQLFDRYAPWTTRVASID